MSETVGLIVIIAGIAVSAVGMWLLARTSRQILGLLLVVVGLMGAGTGLLTVEDTTVEERPPVTVESTPVSAAPEA